MPFRACVPRLRGSLLALAIGGSLSGCGLLIGESFDGYTPRDGGAAGTGNADAASEACTWSPQGDKLFGFESETEVVGWGVGWAYEKMTQPPSKAFAMSPSASEGHACPGVLQLDATFSAGIDDTVYVEHSYDQTKMGTLHVGVEVQTLSGGKATFLDNVEVQILNDAGDFDCQLFRADTGVLDGGWHDLKVNLSSDLGDCVTKVTPPVTKFQIRFNVATPPAVDTPIVIYLDDIWVE